MSFNVALPRQTSSSGLSSPKPFKYNALIMSSEVLSDRQTSCKQTRLFWRKEVFIFSDLSHKNHNLRISLMWVLLLLRIYKGSHRTLTQNREHTEHVRSWNAASVNTERHIRLANKVTLFILRWYLIVEALINVPFVCWARLITYSSWWFETLIAFNFMRARLFFSFSARKVACSS